MEEQLLEVFRQDMFTACFKILNKKNQPMSQADDPRIRNCFNRYFQSYEVVMDERRRISEEEARKRGRRY